MVYGEFEEARNYASPYPCQKKQRQRMHREIQPHIAGRMLEQGQSKSEIIPDSNQRVFAILQQRKIAPRVKILSATRVVKSYWLENAKNAKTH